MIIRLILKKEKSKVERHRPFKLLCQDSIRYTYIKRLGYVTSTISYRLS